MPDSQLDNLTRFHRGNDFCNGSEGLTSDTVFDQDSEIAYPIEEQFSVTYVICQRHDRQNASHVM